MAKRKAPIVLAILGVACSIAMGQNQPSYRRSSPRYNNYNRNRSYSSYQSYNYNTNYTRYTPYPRNGQINSQLYVTGQVTGLRAFRGNVPYTAADEIRLNLPSASQRNFRRASINASQAATTNTFQARPFYEPTQTIFDMPRIRAGYAVPGSSKPITSTPSTALVQKIYGEVNSVYKPITTGQTAGELAMPGGTRDAYLPALQIGSIQRTPDVAFRPASWAPFAVSGSVDRQQLVEQLRNLDRQLDRDDQTQRARPGFENVTGAIDARIDSTIDANLPSVDQPFPSAMVPDRLAGAIDANVPQAPARYYPGQIVPRLQSLPTLPEPGQDVYIDLLVQLRQQRVEELRGRGLVARPTDPFAGRADPESLRSPGFEMETEQPQAGQVTYDPKRGLLVIRGFAGQAKNDFNRYMNNAQTKLKAGKYYAAAMQYRYAATLDSNNPLARLGMGLCQFIAGEPLVAGLNVRRAMSLMPAMMETRIDLPAMLPQKDLQIELDALDERLAEDERLRQRLDLGREPNLLLLATFLHHNLGQQNKAKRWAAVLKEATENDPLVQTFATYVLTGKRPGDKAAAPESQPVK